MVISSSDQTTIDKRALWFTSCVIIMKPWNKSLRNWSNFTLNNSSHITYQSWSNLLDILIQLYHWEPQKYRSSVHTTCSSQAPLLSGCMVYRDVIKDLGPGIPSTPRCYEHFPNLLLWENWVKIESIEPGLPDVFIWQLEILVIALNVRL